MNKLQSVIRYFTFRYPHSDELSNARLTKMVYLADWCSMVWNGHQITNINWYFHHYGPFVEDVEQEAFNDEHLKVFSTTNTQGGSKILIKRVVPNTTVHLDRTTEIPILDHVINETRSLYFNGFINLVYDTYPIKISERYQFLDLGLAARLYNQQNNYRDPILQRKPLLTPSPH